MAAMADLSLTVPFRFDRPHPGDSPDHGAHTSAYLVERILFSETLQKIKLFDLPQLLAII
ncbi:MAG: hypothetical protein U5R30_04325 [Deltaproteobacteria bacterium]|nr:hypothetical protein [Deltaproteobacteria bacterium]